MAYVFATSMYFLLKKDNLAVPYFVLQIVFACIVVLPTAMGESTFLRTTGTSPGTMNTLPKSLRRHGRTFVMVRSVGPLSFRQATYTLFSRCRSQASCSFISLKQQFRCLRATRTFTTTRLRRILVGTSSLCSCIFPTGNGPLQVKSRNPSKRQRKLERISSFESRIKMTH